MRLNNDKSDCKILLGFLNNIFEPFQMRSSNITRKAHIFIKFAYGAGVNLLCFILRGPTAVLVLEGGSFGRRRISNTFQKEYEVRFQDTNLALCL